jgi:hypothetical protein
MRILVRDDIGDGADDGRDQAWSRAYDSVMAEAPRDGLTGEERYAKIQARARDEHSKGAGAPARGNDAAPTKPSGRAAFIANQKAGFREVTSASGLSGRAAFKANLKTGFRGGDR